MSSFIHRSRVALIRMGKAIPFFFCFLVLIDYSECLISLSIGNYVQYGDYTLIDIPLSWFLGRYFEYNVQTLAVITVTSCAIETCYWNKLAILYLAIQLWEKSFFAAMELYPEHIYTVTAVNILLSVFFCYKGLTILTSRNK